MLVLIIIQLVMVIMFYTFSYLILKKQYYGLINGFWSKPKHEQKELIEKGYPQANGKMLHRSGTILLIGLILYLIGIPYMIEISYLFLVIFILSNTLLINRMENEKVKKRNKYILIGSSIFFIALISILFIPNQIEISDDELKISGPYGVTWNIEEIDSVERLEKLPTINLRTNGISIFNKRIGHFQVESFGNSRLILNNLDAPFLLIQKEEQTLFLNESSFYQTEELYEQLMNLIN
ncbi:DUF3784 domain-containing protein [Alkalihalobacillus trypoxylicola]|uniref:Bacterial Pleckstrin homology domain-containing protein n=1 Tax=Alkalihalobacillus trypoxylicola TaxID=519424 RepID=A0A161P9F1_9BACI|nr:DUF3784 domain-containing protein [Alkalihalobacillus trypoxylicola]KYG27680.1 hypothetical protein AZF04_10845 [Alkalihalobacillus trypoxylicola]